MDYEKIRKETEHQLVQIAKKINALAETKAFLEREQDYLSKICQLQAKNKHLKAEIKEVKDQKFNTYAEGERYRVKLQFLKSKIYNITDNITGSQLAYTDTPRLSNPKELYYTGFGCDWGTDLDGRRYHKRYRAELYESDLKRHAHLNDGDIIDEKARVKKILEEELKGILKELRND